VTNRTAAAWEGKESHRSLFGRDGQKVCTGQTKFAHKLPQNEGAGDQPTWHTGKGNRIGDPATCGVSDFGLAEEASISPRSSFGRSGPPTSRYSSRSAADSFGSIGVQTNASAFDSRYKE
jgi:hypothetical protein